MYFFYSIVYTIGFLLMLPVFLLNRQKYASGFSQRLGNYPEFKHDNRKVIWLHCVSVGETNAARPLVDKLIEEFPDHRLIISTITKTGQDLAKKIFADKADAVFYFPFDWKFTVRRALRHFQPSLVLLMETELWPRFIHEAKRSGAKIAIVNGRLSERSSARYRLVGPFMRQLFNDVDMALMQTLDDGKRIEVLGMNPQKVRRLGNLKVDNSVDLDGGGKLSEFAERFGVSANENLIIAASTHDPEERWILEAFEKVREKSTRPLRLVIAPRHPERFGSVANLISNSGFSMARRSAPKLQADQEATVILLDTIGELAALYPLARLVFVGGSLIPHGGQSIFEPAAAERAIVTGPYTANFNDAVSVFLENDALLQLDHVELSNVVEKLSGSFSELLSDLDRSSELGRNAITVINAGRGATMRTVENLKRLTSG